MKFGRRAVVARVFVAWLDAENGGAACGERARLRVEAERVAGREVVWVAEMLRWLAAELGRAGRGRE